MTDVLTICDSCREWVWRSKMDTNKCPKCGGIVDTPRIRRGDGLQVVPDRKGYLSENMGHKPVWIDGKAQYREELKRRNLVCPEEF